MLLTIMKNRTIVGIYHFFIFSTVNAYCIPYMFQVPVVQQGTRQSAYPHGAYYILVRVTDNKHIKCVRG